MTDKGQNREYYERWKEEDKENKDKDDDEDEDDGGGVVFSPKLVGSCLEPVTDPDGSCWEVGPTPHLDSCSRNGNDKMICGFRN